MAANRIKLAILASGNGSNAQAIMDRIKQGCLDAEICLIISNNPDAGVLERAASAGIPHLLLNHRNFSSRETHDFAILEELEKSGCEWVILAGYMRLLSRPFLDRFRHRILNIHPALLPSFPGTHGVGDAISYGVKITGPTVHFVEELMDTGPVVIQGAFAMDALLGEAEILEKMHALEHEIYPQAIQWLAEKRLIIQEGKTLLKPDNRKRKRYLPGVLVSPPLEEQGL